MARIRSVKPGFLKHELLQDLEDKHPALRPMLTYLGLWLVADREGCFEWRPRQLHLDILAFLPCRMEESLVLLQKHGFIRKYEAEGKAYGWIPTFKRHQRISGYEAVQSPRCPTPPPFEPGEEAPQQQVSSTEEAGQQQEPGDKPKKQKTAQTPQNPLAALLLPDELECWFQAIWFEVWPSKVLQGEKWIRVDRGPKASARDRFKEHSRLNKPVALYLAARAYVKNSMKAERGYVQEVATFFGPGKQTYKDYLEDVLPYLDAHPSLAGLTAPPESEEAFRQLIAQDEKPREVQE